MWFGDIGLGDHVLNWFLDEEVRPYAGMGLKAYFDDALVYVMFLE